MVRYSGDGCNTGGEKLGRADNSGNDVHESCVWVCYAIADAGSRFVGGSFASSGCVRNGKCKRE